MTKALIEKQVKDLRVRLENQSAKFMLKEEQYKETILMLTNDLGATPGQIEMLQKYIAERESVIDRQQDETQKLKEENNKLQRISYSKKIKNSKKKQRKNFKKLLRLSHCAMSCHMIP